jgi:hypothetical protein
MTDTNGPPPRLLLARDVAQLLEDGLTQREIAEALSLSRSYVYALITDPDGTLERKRRERYRVPCRLCGTPLHGSDGYKGQTGRTGLCRTCLGKVRTRWTPETILQAFRNFHTTFGRTPTTTDIIGTFPSIARHLTPARVEEARAAHGLLPHPATVTNHFGSWPNAVKQAGLPPAPQGKHSHRHSNP